MHDKIALVTGVTGQDGSYLVELLLEKGYQVHGIKRRASSFNTERLDHIADNDALVNGSFDLHYSDMTDGSSLVGLIKKVQPTEIYNLAAQSHVAVSFELPEYTADVNALGALRLLEAIRLLNLEKKTKFYQASTSELYGLTKNIPQNEETPFYPRSPYAVAKLYAYWITVNYREAYGIYACNGILFNHESPRRGGTFVTRKITQGLCNISQGLQDCLYLGNLDAKRDWGHAKDYVEMQWLMLQQDKPEDFVVATGQQSSIRDFVLMTAKELGIELTFEGSGLDEIARVTKIDPDKTLEIKLNDIIVRISSEFFRPTEVDNLLGDSSKAREKLGWSPTISIEQLCRMMVEEDLNTAKQNSLLANHGYQISLPQKD